MTTPHKELDKLENTSIVITGTICTLGVFAVLFGNVRYGIIIFILNMIPFGTWMYVKGYRKCLNGEAIDE